MTILLDKKSISYRKCLIDVLIHAGRGHLGATLSLLEIFRVLYEDVTKINKKNFKDKNKDIIILSKGHGCLAQYILLENLKILKRRDLYEFCKFGALWGGHTDFKVPGIKFSTGSLGHGLSIATGLAISKQIKGEKQNIYVILGDGELNEGSNWEAFLSINKHRLNNLNIIIDNNKIQSAGYTDKILSLYPLKNKFESFNLEVFECNGHDVKELKTNFRKMKMIKNRSKILIANTVKGKGIKTIENNPDWHHLSKFNPKKHLKILLNGINFYEKLI